MAKARVKYRCQECGYELAKWAGRCPGCQSWNTIVEEPAAALQTQRPLSSAKSMPITEVEREAFARYVTGIGELDRVLGGGIVPASLILVGGDPGVGKSTLLMQAACLLSKKGKILYVSGEESKEQLRLRAERLGTLSERLLVLSENELENIVSQIEAEKPLLAIVDSIQTIYSGQLASAPGSVGQVRECTAQLLYLAKGRQVPIILVGHITKAGGLAGPKVLEHMVDAVLYFEGSMEESYRVLRAVKNRFGSTDEIGVFAMGGEGLTEVENPSEFFLAQRPKNAAGSVVVATMEGSRPLLVEVQALVGATAFGGVPRRQASGLDHNRVSTILAVLERRVGLNIGSHDVYMNAVGGLRLNEPAVDLGIAAALASSFKNKPVSGRLVVIGEVGLTGEVRAVRDLERRVAEAGRLGFEKCLIPYHNWRRLGKRQLGPELIPVHTACEALQTAMF
jgi:DNA repair protein RadA/Sms